MITCFFQFELTCFLIAEATKNLKLLKKYGVIKLTIGYCTIYDLKNEKEEGLEAKNEIIKKMTMQIENLKEDRKNSLLEEDNVSIENSHELQEINEVIGKPDDNTSPISSGIVHHHGSESWYPTTKLIKRSNSDAQSNVTHGTRQLANVSSKILEKFNDEIVDNLSKNQSLCLQLIESLEGNLLISTTEKEHALKTSNSIIRSKIIIGVLNTIVQRATNPSKSFGEILSTFDQFESLKSLSEKMKEKAIAEVDLTDQEILYLINKANQAILKYSSKLSTVYKKIEPDNKWSPINTLQPYINLAITKLSADSAHLIHVSVDDVDVMKRLSIEDLCQIPQGSWVLIQGSPGIGKSMLTYEMCKRWMNGTDLQHYSLVLLLQLHDSSVHSKWKLKTLDDLICHYVDESWKSELIKELNDSGGEGVLIILDGYDELSREMLSDTKEILDKLFSKFSKASVIITTRYSAAHYLIGSDFVYDYCIVLLGFTSHSRSQYIDEYFKDNPAEGQSFRSHVAQIPLISACLYVPLYLYIVLHIFDESKALPGTMTELYEKLVHLLVIKHFKAKAPANQMISIKDLRNVPGFQAIAKFAYDNINRRSLVFYESNDYETLGLMNKEVQFVLDEGGDVFAYSFLHLTIQEFLAAFYMHIQFSDRQLSNFLNDKQNIDYHPFMMRFLAGLTGLRSAGIKLPFSSNVTNLSLFHMLLESKNERFISSVLNQMRNTIVSRTNPPNIFPQDMYALGKCISLSSQTWELGFTLRSLTHDHVRMLVEGVNSNGINKPVSFIMKCIKLPLNPIGSEGVIELFKLPGFIFKSMSQLFLRCVSADSECLKSSSSVLVKVAHLHSLKEFLFHDNNFKEGEQKLLIQVLVKLPLLCHVSFSQLSSDECSLLLRGSSSIATIELYNILSSAIKSVISCLPNAISLQHLQIHQSEVTPADIQDLPSILPSSSIKSLHFNNCAITSDTARSILTAVAASPTVETLSLDDNILDDECGEYIAMNMESIANKHLLAPSTNKLPFKLKELSLVRNPFTEKSIKLLMDKRTSILNIKTTDLK
jgi:hypothetical protein